MPKAGRPFWAWAASTAARYTAPGRSVPLKTWHGHCEHCLGCLQWCPKEAIQFRKVTLKYKRYHHPAVKAEDMILKICH